MKNDAMRSSKVRAAIPWLILFVIVGAVIGQLVISFLVYQRVSIVMNKVETTSGAQKLLVQSIGQVNKDISKLEADIAHTTEGIATLEELIFGEVDEPPYEDGVVLGVSEEPGSTDNVFIGDGRVIIPYFSQYWSNLSSVSSAHVFDSRNDITVDQQHGRVLISTDFVRDQHSHHVEIELLPSGVISFKGANQYEAEVVMQRLLDNLLEGVR